jgi:hypothetical protein
LYIYCSIKFLQICVPIILILSYLKDHCEEFAACGDTWSSGYSMNEEYGT